MYIYNVFKSKYRTVSYLKSFPALNFSSMERENQEGEKILNVFQKREMRLNCTVCNKGIKLGQGKTNISNNLSFIAEKTNMII